MSVIFLVLPIALGVVLIAVLAYSWAVRRGQFDDLTTPAIRMLHDDAESAAAADDGEVRRGSAGEEESDR